MAWKKDPANVRARLGSNVNCSLAACPLRWVGRVPLIGSGNAVTFGSSKQNAEAPCAGPPGRRRLVVTLWKLNPGLGAHCSNTFLEHQVAHACKSKWGQLCGLNKQRTGLQSGPANTFKAQKHISFIKHQRRSPHSASHNAMPEGKINGGPVTTPRQRGKSTAAY